MVPRELLGPSALGDIEVGSQQSATWKRAFPRTWLCWHPDPGRVASRNVSNTFLLLTSHQVFGILSQQPELTKTAVRPLLPVLYPASSNHSCFLSNSVAFSKMSYKWNHTYSLQILTFFHLVQCVWDSSIWCRIIVHGFLLQSFSRCCQLVSLKNSRKWVHSRHLHLI